MLDTCLYLVLPVGHIDCTIRTVRLCSHLAGNLWYLYPNWCFFSWLLAILVYL